MRRLTVTWVASVVTVGSTAVATTLLARGLGPEEFGAYALARRLLATVAPFVTVGVGVALARHVALSEDRQRQREYLLSGFLLAIGPTVGTAFIVLVARYPLAIWIFRSRDYVPLLLWLSVVLCGYSCFTVLYAFHRGRGAMGRTSAWDVAVNGVGLLGVAWLCSASRGADGVMAGLAVVLVIPAVGLAWNLGWVVRETWSDLAPCLVRGMGQLARYGLPRIGHGLAFAALWGMGPLLAPHFAGLREAGYLAIGLVLLRMLEVAIAPLGTVLLPTATQLLVSGRREFLSDRVSDMLAAVLHCGVFATFRMILWADAIVVWWVGPTYTDAIPLARTLLLSITPYAAYVALRSVVDALDERAVNTWIAVMALTVGLAAAGLLGAGGGGAMGLAMGTTVGVTVMGGLTVLYVQRTFGLQLGDLLTVRVVAANALLAVPSLLARWGLGAESGRGWAILAVIGLETGLGAAYYIVLRGSGARWTEELEKRMVSARQQ